MLQIETSGISAIFLYISFKSNNYAITITIEGESKKFFQIK